MVNRLWIIVYLLRTYYSQFFLPPCLSTFSLTSLRPLWLKIRGVRCLLTCLSGYLSFATNTIVCRLCTVVFPCALCENSSCSLRFSFFVAKNRRDPLTRPAVVVSFLHQKPSSVVYRLTSVPYTK